MSRDVVEKIQALVTPAVEAAGYELVEAQWKREQPGWVVRLLVDKPGGITHADCERVSRVVSVLFDVHDIIPHAFSLEVSSPGLDRPLLRPGHFQRFAGKSAKVRLKAGIEGRRNFTGTIVAADEARLTLEVDGKEHLLPFADLDRANLVIESPFELESVSKEGK